MTTVDFALRRAVTIAPGAESVICGSIRLTVQQEWDRISRLVGALRARGLDPGSRIGVLSANCHRVLELYQGAPSAGLVLVPLNTRYAPAELLAVLADAECSLLFTDQPVDDRVTTLVGEVIDLGDGYEALLAGATPTDLGATSNEDDPAVLYYTGGTTGRAKGVILTHRNLMANATHLLLESGLTAEDSWLVMAPRFHVAGTFAVLACSAVAATQVVQPTFDPPAALDLMADHGITATIGVPTMVAALAETQLAAPRDVHRLRLLTHAGAPIAIATVRRAHEAFPAAELVHYYGATETAPLVTSVRHEEQALGTPRERSCGQPVVGVDVRIAAPDGDALPTGEVGEVLVRGPNVMQGYWRNPEATAAAFHGAWYRTGDLGRLDDAGHLYLVDRVKDMIVTGGENVYSTEVENALCLHSEVKEAAVFGVPDATWGEAVHAIVVLDGATGSDDLRRHCREVIADYKVPKAIEIRGSDDPLPKSGAGKVLKHLLREPHWAGEELRVHG